jgi:hypothetical protein
LSEIVTCVALVAATVSVEELPSVILTGLAVIVTVGLGLVGVVGVVGVVGAGAAVPLPHEVMVERGMSVMQMNEKHARVGKSLRTIADFFHASSESALNIFIQNS